MVEKPAASVIGCRSRSKRINNHEQKRTKLWVDRGPEQQAFLVGQSEPEVKIWKGQKVKRYGLTLVFLRLFRKPLKFGVVAGASATLGIYVLAFTLIPAGSPVGGMFGMWLAVPTLLICKLLGLPSPLDGDSSAPLRAFLNLCLVTAVNSVLFSLFASLAKLALSRRRTEVGTKIDEP